MLRYVLDWTAEVCPRFTPHNIFLGREELYFVVIDFNQAINYH